MAPQAMLKADRVAKIFTTHEGSIEVLRGIDVLFEQGTSYAITGASGSGKSTLIHILAGLDVPSSGSIFFNDANVAAMSESRKNKLHLVHLGTMFQFPYLIKELSVIENVFIRGLIAGMSSAACTERARELLEAVGLADKASGKPVTLSGGQQQRVALARALFCRPTFLLADEPTGNLDEKTSFGIVNLLLDCQRDYGMGIVVSSHDPRVAGSMDFSYLLKDGLLHMTERL